jgi:hypothetical protein
MQNAHVGILSLSLNQSHFQPIIRVAIVANFVHPVILVAPLGLFVIFRRVVMEPMGIAQTMAIYWMGHSADLEEWANVGKGNARMEMHNVAKYGDKVLGGG